MQRTKQPKIYRGKSALASCHLDYHLSGSRDQLQDQGMARVWHLLGFWVLRD